MSDRPALELRNVSFCYERQKPVLNGLSIAVKRGEIFGLLGPNGAGKSTAFRILMGLDQPDSGSALIDDLEVKVGSRQIYRQVGYMPDIGEVFDSSTVDDLLKFFGRSQGVSESAISQQSDLLLRKFKLTARRSSKLSTLSRGLRQQAHIMRCLIHSPSILVLDEPASHLDPVSRQLLLDILREEAAKGATIVISSHILPELSNFCTSVAIISKGRVLDQGRVSELIDKYQNKYSSYHIRIVDGQSIAMQLLQSHAADLQISALRRVTPEVLTFDIPTDRDRIAGLLQLLVQSGVRLTEFERKRKDIEQIYLEMMRPA